jgi:two-component system, LytTR family, sensor kinase
MGKKQYFQFLTAAIISILVGMVIMVIRTDTFKLPFFTYLWNAGYSVCIGLSLFGNGYFFKWFERKYIFWIEKPVRSLILAVALHLVYSTFAIFFVNWLWFLVIIHLQFDYFWSFGKGIVISEYIVLVIITSITYAISFFKVWKQRVIESEKLKLEAMSLKYRILQNQVNPHFLFNSLNVLGSLIDIDTEKAKTFTRELSMFYRDVLFFKDLEIVSIKEEIDFVKKYVYLQEIRFGAAFNVEFCISEKVAGKVIPLSLQMLVENAIKHNEMSVQNPLKIIVAITDDFELIVENNLQPKKANDSSKTGLQNLVGRYEFLTGKRVIITQDNHFFRVILPLLKQED